jgi:Abnormal spindle-like microcephaly-assoc'd, ASPM-SPD-2-Hydin/Beta-propeller repeat
MSLDLRLRQSPRVSMTASILVLLTLFSTTIAKALAQTSVQPETQAVGQSSAVPSRNQIRRTLLRQPLYFEPAADGAMIRRSPAGTMRLDAGGKAQFAAPGKAAISMVLDGANTTAKPAGEETLPGRSNYLLGNDPALWRTGVSQFSRVRVPAVYPGIDVVYYGNGNQLEHDYLLAPNADPALIRMLFQGATTVTDDSTGDLILRQTASAGAPNEALRLLKPVAYQRAADGAKTPVPVSYRPLADGGYGFALGAYDRRQAVVIDPVILYGSYFGGKYNDSIIDINVASDGSLYLLLTTDSTDLKTVGATAGACIGNCGPANPDLGASSQPDIYIAKLDSTAQTLLFATYLGGSDSDQAFNLALDTDGSVYVSGTSHSADFPIINGYPGGTPVTGGNPAGTLTKLSADGSTILYSTFIGYGLPLAESPTQVGNGAAHAMVTANNGIVYLVGQAGTTDADFLWQKNPLFTAGTDFVAKLDTTKTGTDSVVYATRVGDGDNSTSSAQVTSVAVDSKGDVWLYGETKNSAFPTTTTGALQPQCTTPASTSCLSSFLMEIGPTGASVLYATYLGGSGGTNVTSFDIQLDTSDTIYVSGYTDQSNFPILNGAYPTLPSSASNYISKISSDGKTLLYSTYLQSDIFSVSPDGKVAFTIASAAGFPLKNNLQTAIPTGNNLDAAFGLLDTTLSGADSLLVSSYLGTNTGYTQPQRVYLASTGQILIMGETSATDLPVANAYQPTSGGVYDGFLAIIQPNDTLTLTPTSITFPATSVGSTSAAMTATLFNGTTKSIYLIQGTLTDSKDFTAKDNCGGIMSPQASCTVTFTFTPQAAGTLTSTYSTGDLDNQSNLLTITLTGGATAATVSVSPTSLAFGSVADGSTATQSVTLTNSSDSALPISGATVSGTGFSLTNNTCGASVAANATCQYSVTFSPTEQGPYAGTLTIADSLGSQIVQFIATGTEAKGSEALSPATVNFGNVYEGVTATAVVTYTNNGPGAVNITAATINPPVFKIVTTTCSQQVAAGASCTYTLSYTPIGVFSTQGTFTITDGSSNPSVTLSGTGIQPQDGDVFLLPGSVNFQNVLLASGADQNLTLSNQTSQTIQVLGVNYLFVGTGKAAFSYGVGQPVFCPISTDGHANITLAPYTSCLIGVAFNAANAVVDTTYNAQFDVNWNYVGDTQLHYLATAVTANTISPATAVVTPTTIQFPATPSGKKSLAQVVNVTNGGDQTLGFTGASFNGANPTAFTQTNNCPASLNKNDTCQISVYFTPSASGNEFTANLDVGLDTGDVNVVLDGGTSPSDFVLSSPATTQGGTNPTWSINIAPLTASIGFNEPITFKVSGLDSSYGTPVFTPSTVTPKGGTVSTTMTLTTAPSAAFNQKPGGKQSGTKTALPILACCMAFFFSFRRKLKNYRTWIASIIVVLALTVFALAGCGKSKPPVNFTVTATSGSISHSLTLTLQP